MLDLRRLNGKTNSDKFDTFWNELQTYLDELGLAADERRHSSVLRMPIAISICHLQEIISERLIAKNKGSVDISFGRKTRILTQLFGILVGFLSSLEFSVGSYASHTLMPIMSMHCFNM